MNKQKILLLAISGFSIAFTLIWFFFFAGEKKVISLKQVVAERNRDRQVLDSISEMRQIVASRVSMDAKIAEKRKRLLEGVNRSMFNSFSDKDKKLSEEVQNALDAEDAERTIKLAMKLMGSSNPDARSHAIDAISWFGFKALPELTLLMGDINPDVAQNAINAWEFGFSEIEDAETRLNVSKMALNALFSKDALESIGSHFSIAATEYMEEVEDGDEGLDRKIEVFQSLIDMIDSKNKLLSDTGRELYEELTGHSWVSVEETELYLTDPDNYESPEDRQ